MASKLVEKLLKEVLAERNPGATDDQLDKLVEDYLRDMKGKEPEGTEKDKRNFLERFVDWATPDLKDDGEGNISTQGGPTVAGALGEVADAVTPDIVQRGVGRQLAKGRDDISGVPEPGRSPAEQEWRQSTKGGAASLAQLVGASRADIAQGGDGRPTLPNADDVVDKEYINPSARKPRYVLDDVNKPVANSWSIEQKVDLQRKMVEAGIYEYTGTDEPTFNGRWDDNDRDAYYYLMEQADSLGVSATDLLRQWRKQPIADADAEPDGEVPKPTIRVTNPLDIQYAARDISTDLIGFGIPQAERERLTRLFQGKQISAQQAVQTDQDAGGAGVVADTPGLDTFLEDQIRREYPVEARSTDVLGQYKVLLEMIGMA